MTRQRVLKAVEQLSQSQGGDVSPGRSRTDMDIAVVLPDVGTAFFGEILRGIDSVAHDTDSRVQVACSTYQPQREEAAIRRLVAANVSGLILWSLSTDASNLRGLFPPALPIVVIDHELKQDGMDVGMVVFDDLHGARSAAEYLLNLGHRRIGFVGPYPPYAGFSRSQARILALNEAIKERGLEQEALTMAYADRDDAGYSACMQMLCSKDPPTAIFLNDDSMAPRAYAVIRRLGLVVGQDIAIVGFGDQPICTQLEVPLTTVRQDMPLLGSVAAEVLIGMVGGQVNKQEKVILPAPLIIRESCCPAKSGAGRAATVAPPRDDYKHQEARRRQVLVSE